MFPRSQYLEAVSDRSDVSYIEAIVFLGVGSPFVPANSQIERQSRRRLPFVVEIEPGFGLPEIKVAAVVLIGEVIGKPEEHVGEGRTGEAVRAVAGGIVERCPGTVEIVRTLRL